MLLHRRTNTEREVDVVIRSKVGEHTIVVSVECIDHSRPADITWVENMLKKHEHLPTNRLILVSRSGFYEPAKVLAKSEGVDTYTPDDAIELDWTDIVGKMERLFLAKYDFTPTQHELVIQTEGGPRTFLAGGGTALQSNAGEPIGTLQDFVTFVLSTNHDIAGAAMTALDYDGEKNFTAEFNSNSPVFAVDDQGQGHLIERFRIRVICKRVTSPIELTPLSWHGVPVAFGYGDTALGAVTLTIVEQGPGETDIAFSVNNKDIAMLPPKVIPLSRPTQAPLDKDAMSATVVLPPAQDAHDAKGT